MLPGLAAQGGVLDRQDPPAADAMAGTAIRLMVWLFQQDVSSLHFRLT
jgi:hypothetical protein